MSQNDHHLGDAINFDYASPQDCELELELELERTYLFAELELETQNFVGL